MKSDLSIKREIKPNEDLEKQRALAARRYKQLRTDMALTFGTPEGKRVLKWLLTQCGYQESGIGGNPGIGLNALEGTLYNNARRNVYIELRKLIPHSTLKEVEYDNLTEEIV